MLNNSRRDGATRDARDGAHQSSYSDICGLKPVWRHEEGSLTGLAFSDREIDILLLSDLTQSYQVEVHFVVEDVISALPKYIQQGYTIAIEPFDIAIGKCAVIQDAMGTRVCIFDKTNVFTLTALPGADWPIELR